LSLVIAALFLAYGAAGMWFDYREQREAIGALLQTQAATSADKIGIFLSGIAGQLNATLSDISVEQNDSEKRIQALRTLHQNAAILSVLVTDWSGYERLFVSRVGLDRVGSGLDRSTDVVISDLRPGEIWYGPLTYHSGSEPFITVAVGARRKSEGKIAAEINLKLVWNVISAIHVGRSGYAIVVDDSGHLIAHPDIAKVLAGKDENAALAVRTLRDAMISSGQAAVVDDGGEHFLAGLSRLPDMGWTVIVKQPLSEAYAPIYSALWRLGTGLAFALALGSAAALWLTRRVVGPIYKLEKGTFQIGAGNFDHRIRIDRSDEFGRLASSFNRMAEMLAASRRQSERIARLKRFLVPHVAELVDRAEDDTLLAPRRADVVALFCDLRGFTAFCARAEPEEVFRLLHEYYEALGAAVTANEAAVMRFSGDGLMVLVNAPLPCPDPAPRAVRTALDMQRMVQKLLADWRSRGHSLGFGVGMAMGWATVGEVGYGDRVEYTANGTVINLAARLCAEAGDGQILLDPAVAFAIHDHFPIVSLGTRTIKGYGDSLDVYEVVTELDASPLSQA
jgi:class 3 adenylate cyclase